MTLNIKHKKLNKFSGYFIILLMIISCFPAYAKDPPPSLTLTQCVDRAIKNHPKIYQAIQNLAAKKAQVTQARSAYYPSLDFQGSYDHAHSTSTSDQVDPLTGQGGLTLAGINESKQAGLSANQDLMDFGRRTNQVKSSIEYFKAQEALLESSRQQVIFDAKTAYFDVILLKKLLEVAQEEVDQFTLHLEQAQGFYNQGVKSFIEVTKAQADLSQSKLKLIQAKNSLNISWAVLASAMGNREVVEYNLVDTLGEIKFDNNLEEVLEWAHVSRPDLIALIRQVEASRATLEATISDKNPDLSAQGNYSSYKSTQNSSTSRGNQFNWGVVLSMSLFDGNLRNGRIAQARASMESTKADLDIQYLSANLDVERSFYILLEAQEKLIVAQAGLRQAEENFNLAQGRYEVGLGSPIEYSDARKLLSDAKASYYSALYQLQVAHDALLLATGRLKQ